MLRAPPNTSFGKTARLAIHAPSWCERQRLPFLLFCLVVVVVILVVVVALLVVIVAQLLKGLQHLRPLVALEAVAVAQRASRGVNAVLDDRRGLGNKRFNHRRRVARSTVVRRHWGVGERAEVSLGGEAEHRRAEGAGDGVASVRHRRDDAATLRWVKVQTRQRLEAGHVAIDELPDAAEGERLPVDAAGARVGRLGVAVAQRAEGGR